VFAYQRRLGKEQVVVVLNNSDSVQRVQLPETLARFHWKVLLALNKEKPDRKLLIELQPKSGVVLQTKGR
jgi:hypothetical protein